MSYIYLKQLLYKTLKEIELPNRSYYFLYFLASHNVTGKYNSISEYNL